VVEWAVEAQGERVVLSGTYAPVHVEDRLPEHVPVSPQLLAVESDRRGGVQAVADEEQPLVGLERFRRAVEGEVVSPPAPFHPGALPLVAVVEGACLYSSGGHQRPVHVPGHGDVDTVAPTSNRRAKAPAATPAPGVKSFSFPRSSTSPATFVFYKAFGARNGTGIRGGPVLHPACAATSCRGVIR
jgi:hypothetical protein